MGGGYGPCIVVLLLNKYKKIIIIKHMLKTIGPLGSCKADSLRGIKHFQVFKKADYKLCLKPQTPFGKVNSRCALAV